MGAESSDGREQVGEVGVGTRWRRRGRSRKKGRGKEMMEM